MNSVCISNCVNDARDPRVPIRATYVNLYKWPESDAEFIRSFRRGGCGAPRVVDSISSRQIYLRSYTFSKQEEKPTRNFFGRTKESRTYSSSDQKKKTSKKHQNKSECKKKNEKKRLVMRKMNDISCSALFRFFHRLLSCAASVDVVDQTD